MVTKAAYAEYYVNGMKIGFIERLEYDDRGLDVTSAVTEKINDKALYDKYKVLNNLLTSSDLLAFLGASGMNAVELSIALGREEDWIGKLMYGRIQSEEENGMILEFIRNYKWGQAR